MLELLVLIAWLLISSLFAWLLVRRPLFVLFPLSEEERELRELRHLVYIQRYPILAPFRLPPPSLHPLTRRELIIRMLLVVVLMFGPLILVILAFS